MPHNQSNKADTPIKCIACGKIVGQGFIVQGSIQLLCKCGVKTKIEAETKPEGRVKVFVNTDRHGSQFIQRNLRERI